MQDPLTINIDFNAPITLAGCLRVARSFLHWWAHELIALAPKWLQDKLTNAKGPLSVVVQDDGWYVEYSGQQIFFSNITDLYDARAALVRAIPIVDVQSVDVILPRTICLFKRISLPAAAASRLQDAVRLQLDKLSPFRGDDVRFSCCVASAMNTPDIFDEDNIAVDVVIVPLQRLKQVEQMVRAAGMVPKTYKIDGAAASFQPLGLPWTKTVQQRAITGVLGAIFFIVATVLAPVLRDAEIAELNDQIKELKPDVALATTEREILTRYVLPPQALSKDRGSALEVLFELTGKFPDDIHLTYFAQSGNRISLEGRAPSAVKVRAALNRISMLQNIHVDTKTSDGTFVATAMLRHSPNEGGE